jgi:hypothetical protein
VRRHTGGDAVVGQVRDLSCRAVCAAKELPIDQDSHADSGADRETCNDIDSPGCAQCVLADRTQIGVVFHDHFRAIRSERRHQLVQQATAFPAGQIRRPVHRPGGHVRDTRRPEDSHNDVARGQPCLRDGTFDGFPCCPQQHGPRPAAVRLFESGDDRTVQVCDRDMDHAPADVDTHDVTRVRSRPVDDRGPARTSRTPADRTYQAMLLQIQKCLPDCGFR